MNSSHKANSQAYRDNYDRIFSHDRKDGVDKTAEAIDDFIRRQRKAR